MVVTLVLSGIPQFVTLKDLAINLDTLFDTDEIAQIGTFKVRDLPNIRNTNRRQIAIDFRSGYDAMYAQKLLDKKQYTLPNNEVKELKAKVTADPEHIGGRSPSPRDVQIYRRPSSDSSVDENIPILKMSSKQLKKANEKMEAQLAALEKKKAINKTNHDLLMEQAKLMKELKKLDKKAKSKDKEKKKKKKKKSKKRRLSDVTDEESEPGSSKRQRTGSSSPGTRDTSPTNVRESFSSDARAGSSWQLDSSSEPDSPIRLTETCRKVADLRNKIEERERAKKSALKQHSSDEGVNKDRRLMSPRGSRDRQMCSPKERDSRERNVCSPRERDSDRYGHSTRDSIFRGSRDSQLRSSKETKSERYGYRDSIPRGSRDSPKERDSRERHVRSPRERESDRYGHSSRDSRRSPLGRELRDRRRSSVERDRRRRSSEERVQRSHYPRSPQRRDLELMSPKNRIFKERYSRRDGDRYASSSRNSILCRRSPSLRGTARSSRERDIQPGYISKHRAITYRPNVSESIISEMNHRHEKKEELFAKKEGEAKIIKQDKEIVESEIDESVRKIMNDNYDMIDELAFKFHVRCDERKKLLQYLMKAIKDRFSNLMISGFLPASQMILRYRCKYTEVMDEQLITKLFHNVVAARDEAKVKADPDADIADILQELEALANDITSDLKTEADDDVQLANDIKTEADDDADEDEGGNEVRKVCKLNITLNVVQSEKSSNKQINLVKHIKIEEPDMPTEHDMSDTDMPKEPGLPKESDTAEDQDMSMVNTEKIIIDSARINKYFITIKVLIHRMKIHMVKYRNRINFNKFKYVVREALETRITGLLANVEERLRAKDVYALYRQAYKEDGDEYFIKEVIDEIRAGRYDNVEEASKNAEIAAAPENSPAGEIEPVVKMEVEEDPVPDPSIEAIATGTGTFLTDNTEEVSIKKEPITEETASGAEKGNSKDTMEIETTPVVNMTVKSEPVTDQETNDQQNIASNTNCANNGTDLVVKPIKKEPEAKENENTKEIAEKSGKIRISGEIKKEPVDNQLDPVQKTSDSDAKEKEKVICNIIKTEKQVDVISTPIKQEPNDDNIEKSIGTSVIKEVPKEMVKIGAGKTGQVTMPIPQVIVKPELKHAADDDDDDIMFMGEYIEPKNEVKSECPPADEEVAVVERNDDVIDLSDTEDTIKEEQSADVLEINVSNEGEFECAEVGQPHNLGKDSTIDMSPNRTTSTVPNTDVDFIKSEQTGNRPSIDEVICLSDNEAIEVSDDDDFGDNTNKGTMEEQNMKVQGDSDSSVDTVILDKEINISHKNSNLEQEIENIKVGRANIRPDNAVDNQRVTIETSQSDIEHCREEVSKTCGEGDIFDEVDESIESIKNFLNTQMCAMP